MVTGAAAVLDAAGAAFAAEAAGSGTGSTMPGAVPGLDAVLPLPTFSVPAGAMPLLPEVRT